MQADELRRWVDARRATDEQERRTARPAGPAKSWQQALSLIALVGRMVGWPVPPDEVRRREDSSAGQAWTKLRAGYGHRR
jgi:hypothetical protein